MTQALTVLAVVLGARGVLADVVYLYDDLGRLVRVIRADGEAATYHYDLVGNILRVTRESGVPQTTTVAGLSTSVLPLGATTGVTITGFNFSGATVTGSPGLRVVGLDTGVDTLVVRVSVEQGASLGPAWLTLRTPYGTLTIPVTIVGGGPAVSTFTPTRALPGMVVTVTGADFDATTPANNVAGVNGVPAQLLQVTTTVLTLRVPAGASTGPISVTTLAGTGTSSASLVVGSLGPLRATVPTTDLLAYWTFDEDGRDAGDSRDLTFQNGLSATATGAIGRGLAFSGNPAQVAIRPVSDPVLTFGAADFTWALWVKWISLAGEQVLMEKCQAATLCGGGGWGFTKLPPGDPRGSNRLLAFPLIQSPPEPVVAGRWHHLAVARQGATARMYVDGTQVAQAAVGGLAMTGVAEPFRVGGRAGTLQAFPMNGVIDEIGMWTRALTSAEVAVLAGGFNPGPPVITSLSPARALPGMVVTINGGEFDAATAASNAVRINGAPASVVAATANSLRVRVPAEATTGPVSVTTPWGTSVSGPSLAIGTLGPSRAHVPTTDLLAYWTFDQDGRDDADSLDLTLQAGLATTAPGAIGQGLAFVGSFTQVAIRPVSDPALTFGAADFTWALWVKWNTLAGEQVLMEKCQAATLCGGGGWGFTKLPSGDPRGSNRLLAFPLIQSPPEPVVAGRWHHLAVTRQGGTVRMYVDGAEVAQAAVGGLAMTPVAEPFRVGGRAGNLQAFPMNGVVDEIGMWTRALAPAEVSALAAVRPL